MSVLRSFETRIAGLVEGVFSRAFRSEVRPVEIARKLAREMEEHKTISVSRTYVPNEYSVYLSGQDYERFEGYEAELAGELEGYLLEHARGEHFDLVAAPHVEFRLDERLSLGEFGIQTRLVRPSDDFEAPPAQGDVGHTMVYSISEEDRRPLAATPPGSRALLVGAGRRTIVPAVGGVIGRSRQCDIMLADSNVSRRHAELRPAADGWEISDLGSTNGVRVNGRKISSSHSLSSGDMIELGSSELRFELE